MSFALIEVLYPMILAPLITSVIGFVFSRIGGKERLQRVEHDLKEIDLLQKLMESDEIRIDKDQLRVRMEHIASQYSHNVSEGSLAADLPYFKRPWYQRAVLLPKPQSTGGRILTFGFYMYAVYGLIQLPWVPQIIEEASQRSLLATLGIVGSFVLAAICHALAVRQIGRDRLIEWARGELARKQSANTREGL